MELNGVELVLSLMGTIKLGKIVMTTTQYQVMGKQNHPNFRCTNCVVDSSYTCVGWPSVCTVTHKCGDGIINAPYE